MKSEQFYKLKIIGGLHKDAELFLAPEINYTIGCSDDCDIILLDTGVQPRHFSFCIEQGKICFTKTDIPFCIDGRHVRSTQSILNNYQVVSMGEAHLALGPANEIWPMLSVPQIIPVDQAPSCLDLVLVHTDRNFLDPIKQASVFQSQLKVFLAFISKFDKKILLAAGAFLIVLMVFIYDTWHVTAGPNTVAGDTRKKSMVLSMVSGIMNVKHTTLVGTGLVEPVVPTETKNALPSDDPTDHIRQVLKSTWGPNLTETRNDNNSIQFKGYDRQNRADMLMNIEQNDQGETEANGITLAPKKKKEILSQLGDIIRVKVDAAEDIEGVCRRILEKKGVRRAKAHLDIEQNEFVLQGQADDSKTISSIYEIISKAFPGLKVSNHIKMGYPETSKLDITGVGTGAVSYVIQSDGTKVFKGGKLNNGCFVISIEPDYISVDCQGSQEKHSL